MPSPRATEDPTFDAVFEETYLQAKERAEEISDALLLERQQVEGAKVALYRFFDKDDRLLYVGISLSLALRMTQHRSRSWWHDVVTVRVEWLANRAEATRAEAKAIRTERPLYNIVLNSKPKRTPQKAHIGARPSPEAPVRPFIQQQREMQKKRTV